MSVMLQRARPTPRARNRARIVYPTLTLLTVVGMAVSLWVGPLDLTPTVVLRSVLGLDADNDFLVMDLGLPRVVLAVLVGAGLGVAGALMQAHTRNPLGSPDVIGFGAGASLGAVIALIPLHLRGLPVGVAAVIGGLVTALVVLACAGGASRAGFRLIVVGIAISALVTGVSSYLLTRAALAEAINAQRWLSGSLNDATWIDCLVMLVAAVVLIPLASMLRRPLVALQLGEEVGVGLGVRVSAVQFGVVIVSVLLSAAAVMTAGPVAFISLAAPQIVVRLVRRPAPLIVGSALTGALLMVLSDLMAQNTIPGYELPVGIATGVVGGLYLAWLLTKMWRRT